MSLFLRAAVRDCLSASCDDILAFEGVDLKRAIRPSEQE